jgi:hypothetical protein
MAPADWCSANADLTWPAGRFIRHSHPPIQISGQASSCTRSRTPPMSKTTALIVIAALPLDSSLYASATMVALLWVQRHRRRLGLGQVPT